MCALIDHYAMKTPSKVYYLVIESAQLLNSEHMVGSRLYYLLVSDFRKNT